MLPNARSYKQGQLSDDEVLAAVALFRDDYKIRKATDALDEIESYTSDIFVVDGALRVEGDLDLMQEQAYLLVVRGDLVVGGCYHDYDHPESFLLVTGDLRARDVITAGWLEVHGDLVADRVVGDYNDCSAQVGGDIRTSLFYGEQHHFQVGGELHGIVIGHPRLTIAKRPAIIPPDDRRLLEHLAPALLRTYDDLDDAGQRIVCVDGIKDFRELKRRVASGLPLIGADRPRDS